MDIIRNIDGAIGCGFRHSSLFIHVDNPNAIDMAETQAKRVLERYNISDFTIVLGSRQVKEFSIGVGTKVSGRHVKGTLGGFATNEGTVHGLLARHFVESCPNQFIVDENNQKIGTVQASENRGSLDIAAAKMEISVLNGCDLRFKDSYGDHMTSKLYPFSSTETIIEDLQDLPVHIWGSASTPGRGKIIVPEYFVPDMDRLVLVEDLEGDGKTKLEKNKRFASPGDSGSVVCSNDIDGDYVQVISMFMGSINFNEVEADPKLKGNYLSFRMGSGLEQLNDEIGGTFFLC